MNCNKNDEPTHEALGVYVERRKTKVKNFMVYK